MTASRLPFPFPVVTWRGGAVVLLDQRALPGEVRWRRCTTVAELAAAIADLTVRGAPAIGVAAAWGMLLAWERIVTSGVDGPDAALARLAADRDTLAATRPTAVNLFWALDRQWRAAVAAAPRGVAAVREALADGARAIHADDIARGRALGEAGAALLPDPAVVLTHCNAGGLATGGYGTALGVVYAAADAGKRVRVYADETRPLLQGARLTAWELRERGIPVTVLCDGAAAGLLAAGEVDAVVVGADRIARNGDTANKVGTYGLALAARRHGVPFYVAAPLSTVDPDAPDGAAIPIEQRDPDEVHAWRGVRVTPEGVDAWNPAFDVTPADLVTAIVTEAGVLRPPYAESLGAALRGRDGPAVLDNPPPD